MRLLLPREQSCNLSSPQLGKKLASSAFPHRAQGSPRAAVVSMGDEKRLSDAMGIDSQRSGKMGKISLLMRRELFRIWIPLAVKLPTRRAIELNGGIDKALNFGSIQRLSSV
jgi:hypothetical protein